VRTRATSRTRAPPTALAGQPSTSSRARSVLIRCPATIPIPR
jgi:hypothetical protein